MVLKTGSTIVLQQQGEELARKWGGVYAELSAKEGPDLKKALESTALRFPELGKLSRTRYQEVFVEKPQSSWFLNPCACSTGKDIIKPGDHAQSSLGLSQSMADYFFDKQFSHHDFLAGLDVQDLEWYSKTCFETLGRWNMEAKLFEERLDYRFFSFVLSLSLNLSLYSPQIASLLYEEWAFADLQNLQKLLQNWQEQLAVLSSKEAGRPSEMMEYLKSENDFLMLVDATRQLTFKVLGCSQWAEEQPVEHQFFLMDLNNMSIDALRRIVGSLRDNQDHTAILEGILAGSGDKDSPFYRYGGRYASLSELVLSSIREPHFR